MRLSLLLAVLAQLDAAMRVEGERIEWVRHGKHLPLLVAHAGPLVLAGPEQYLAYPTPRSTSHSSLHLIPSQR